MHIGIDFGTTNSSLASADAQGGVSLTTFPWRESLTESFRSLLYLERWKEGSRSTIKSWGGPCGIERYLNSDDKGRLIQSLKSFLTSRSLISTEIFGRQFQLEELIARILREIRTAAELQFGKPIHQAVAGRPVRFVGAESEADDEYAEARLRKAYFKAGFEQVVFELEPVGAACHYESTLDHDELILIGDFGGGTSDFSLLRVGPARRKNLEGGHQVLGNAGVAIAGDAFDAKIVRHLVSPALGAGTMLNSHGKRLPVPNWVYFKLERWHHLSFLKSRETLTMLQSVATQALAPDQIRALLWLVEHDLGYPLHQAVQQLKARLSTEERAEFKFEDGDVELREQVSRARFESWIGEELTAIEAGVDHLLKSTGTVAAEVDKVFLTGGSSFVPAVRRIFSSRFGDAKIETGGEFTSVARGLALRALDMARKSS
jgi:hypothetical chaperone protein